MATLILQPGPSEGIDTHLLSSSPGSNFGGAPFMTIAPETGGSARALIKFDLSAVPAGATIVSAQLKMFTLASTDPLTISVYRSLVEWYEFGSTWNHRNYSGSVPWAGGAGGGAGIDYVATPTASQTQSAGIQWTWTVTSDVNGFHAGSFPNYGWWLIRSAGTGWADAYSSDYAHSPTARPWLVIEYEFRIFGSTSGIASQIASISADAYLGGSTGAGVSLSGLLSTNLMEGQTAGSATQSGTLSTNLINGSVTGVANVGGGIDFLFIEPTGPIRRGPVSHALPLLYLTNGQKIGGRTQRFDFLSKWIGFCVEEWRPAIAQYKNGGVWSDSALAHGRQLVSYVYENPIESLTVRAHHHTQNHLITYTQDLLRWLRLAADYWVSGGKYPHPVYLVARAAYEDNTRYAVIYDGHVPELKNPYAQPFFGESASLYDELTVLLERGHWQDVPPGESTCLPVGNRKQWTFQQWTSVVSPPAGQVNAFIQTSGGAVLAGMGTNGQIYRSTDEGLTWSLYATLTGADSSTAINAFAQLPDGTLYAAVTGADAVRGIWRSVDAGATWTRIFYPAIYSSDASTVAGYYDIFYDQSRNRLLASGGGVSSTPGVGSSGIVSRYNLSTETWSHWEKAPFNYFKTISVDSSGRIYAGWYGGSSTAGAVVRSTDTWFVIESQPVTWTPAQGDETGKTPNLWLRAEDIGGVSDGARFEIWPAAPGTTFSAKATANEEPTYLVNGLNGFPVVRFDGTDYMDTTFDLTGSNGWTVITLIRDRKADGGSHTVWGETSTSASSPGKYYLELRRVVTDMYVNTNYDRLNVDVNWSVDTWQTLSVQISPIGPFRRLYRNGSLIGSDYFSGGVPSPAVLRIGGRQDGTLSFDGDIVEIIAYRGHISDAHRAKVEQYLNLKYNLGQSIESYQVVASNLRVHDLIRLGNDLLYTTEQSGGGDVGYIYRLASPTYDVPLLHATTTKLYRTLYPDPRDPLHLWAGAGSAIHKSESGGSSWSSVTTPASTTILALLRTQAGTMLGGGSTQVVRLSSAGDIVFVGVDATCDPVPIVPQFVQSNLTHVFVFDASSSTYTRIYPASSLPVSLFPDSPAVGDILYVGAQTTLSGTQIGYFNTIAFSLSPEFLASGITLVWEYWNGSWVSLGVQDQTLGLTQPGLRTVNWATPANWTTTTVNGVTGWWVRARITAVSNPVAPKQTVQDIMAVTDSFVEADDWVVQGEIPALSRIRWENTSVHSIDRLIVGLRSFDEVSVFSPFLNISDQQTPPGITISKHNNASWVTSMTSATGRALVVSFSSGLNQWYDIVTFSLSTTVARDYYGNFRVFLRCYHTVGDSDDWKLRLKMAYGSSGSVVYSREQAVTSLLDGHVADLGSISIPVIQALGLEENLADSLLLTVQGFPTAIGNQLILYDLVLIPLDEWAVDLVSPSAVNFVSSPDTSQRLGVNDYLDIDSRVIRPGQLTATKRNSGGFIETIYQAVTGGPGILQVGRKQRLFFLPMVRSTGTGTPWISHASMCGRVTVEKVQRYLSARGFK